MGLTSSGGPPAAGVTRAGLGASPPDGPSSSPGESLPRPRLEDEIDLLAQELARQEPPRHSPLSAQPQPEARQRQLEPGETQPIPPGASLPLLTPELVLVF